VLCVIGVIAGIYTLRTVLYQEIGSDAQIIASILNVIQIQVLTFVYDHLAFKLTDLENRRNDVLYEDSMIIKLFLFQFVNNYSSFYYLAFIAGSLPVPNGANKDSRVSYRILAVESYYFTSLLQFYLRLN
jgi:Calcium-activated chloride channel